MNSIYDSLGITSPVSISIISIAIMLFVGFLLTRLTKLLRLPNVTAYIVARSEEHTSELQSRI